MSFLEKLRDKPEHIRKMILWTVVIVLGAALLLWWLQSSYRSLKEFQQKDFIESLNIPDFQAGLDELPQIDIPEIDEETVKQLEEAWQEDKQN